MSQYISVTSKGNYIHDVGYNMSGKKYYRKVKFQPKCFVESNIPNTNVKTLFNKSTQVIQFDNISEYRKYTNKNKSISQGTIDPVIQYIRHNYTEDVLNITPNTLFFDIEVYSNTGEFPSPKFTKYPVNSISCYSTKNRTYYLLSLKEYDKTKNSIDIDPNIIRFKHCSSEQELLKSFIKIIQFESCDILSGWNSSQFDVPYIINRMGKVIGSTETKTISPFKNVFTKITQRKNKTTKAYEDYYISKMDGIVLIDYMELYKKYIVEPRESYKLDFIAVTELGEGKLNYSEFDNLRVLWEKNPQLYSDYNIVDTKLLNELDENLKLINLHSIITYKSKCNLFDSMSPVKLWESYLYNEMLNRNVCFPVRQTYEESTYPGAFVVEPVPGYYENIVTFDLASLYPNINIQYNLALEKMVDLESFKKHHLISIKDDHLKKYIVNGFDDEIDRINVDYLVDNDLSDELQQILKLTGHTLTPNKYFWSIKTKSTVSIILRDLFDERKSVKRSMGDLKKELINDDVNVQSEIKRLNNKQKAIKTMMNAYYGITGNRHFILYHLEIATATTLSAQLASKYIEKYILNHEKLNKFNMHCITGDTDSRFFCVDNIIKKLVANKKIANTTIDKMKFINKFSKEKIQPIIIEGYDKISDEFNIIENRMVMELEKICLSGVFTSKKHYALSVYSDGDDVYDKPELKVTGLEIVKSSTPACVKPFLKESLKKILDKKDIVSYIKECKKEYDKFEVEKLAFPRSANNFEKWLKLKKGTPIGVRSAFVFNEYIDKYNMECDYEKIRSGDKIKFIYLKKPNCVSSDVIGFLRRLPKELHDSVDKEVMWEKSFMSVIRGICEKINIPYEKPQQNINDLF